MFSHEQLPLTNMKNYFILFTQLVRKKMAKEKEAKTKVKSPSALKRERQNDKREQNNKVFKSRVKTAALALSQALTLKDKAKSEKALDTLYALMDKGVKRNLFKKNKADRVKSRAKCKVMATS